MLLQALAEYADTYLADELNDAAFESKPVPWLLEISPTGLFLGAIPRMTTVTRGKKQIQVARPLRLPRSPVNRNSGHHPLLGVDDIAYVLGVGPWTADKPADRAKAEKHFAAFVRLIEAAARATKDDALAACARFYGSEADVEQARMRLAAAKAGTVVALSVGGAIVERPVIQKYWRAHYQTAFAQRVEGSVGECLLSGTVGPIAPTHEKIKGASNLGGQASGVSLMSFDKESFRSYGWDQNQNSPVSPDRALAYVLALNALLRSGDAATARGGRRRDVAGIGFLTWLRSPDDFDALDVLERPDPDEVKALLGFEPGATPDVNRFYLMGMSGNGGRLRIRYWVSESLEHIRANLKGWHMQLRRFYPGDDVRPVAFWQLLYAIERDGKPAAQDVLALLRRAIEGSSEPLGYSILSSCLRRLRHSAGQPERKDSGDGRLSVPMLHVPMGLIRMCVNDLRRSKGEQEMSEGLDVTCAEPAYVCGRLMAEFEGLQREANRSSQRSEDGSSKDISSSVLDRYFALASTYPAVAFPKMEVLAQKHLRKLRRDEGGAAGAIDRRLGELHKLLIPAPGQSFPSRLSLDEQGLFMLGYYHQKTWSIGQAREKAEAVRAAASDAGEEK